MGNYCCILFKKRPVSTYTYHYSPKFTNFSPEKVKQNIVTKRKLKCKRCNHCSQNFVEYSPQIFCIDLILVFSILSHIFDLYLIY